ncbi:MAG: HEPN domain-containing protein [Roseiarcus sp.]
MKPQAAAFLEKSRELLDRADTMLGVALNEDAGRTAYLAGFHAAQAFLFETNGRVFKKHATVHGEFGRLTKDDPRFDMELRAFLGRAYNLKAIADYETGPGSRVSAESASAAIRVARRFVECVANFHSANGHAPQAPDATPKP